MSSYKGFRSGSKLPKADVQRRVEAYNKKLQEYDKLSLVQLLELYPTLGGSYRGACIEITRQKITAGMDKLNELEKGKTEEEIDDMETTAGTAIMGE